MRANLPSHIEIIDGVILRGVKGREMVLGAEEALSLWERMFDRSDDTGSCWIWTGYQKNGYGSISFRNQDLYLHRVSFALTHGAEPAGLDVCHTCDTPSCWNPGHLFAGTRQDNMLDCKQKGRAVAPPVHSGEDHPGSSVSDDLVSECREAWATKKYSQRELARMYGVSQSTIWRWLSGVVR